MIFFIKYWILNVKDTLISLDERSVINSVKKLSSAYLINMTPQVHKAYLGMAALHIIS